MDEATFYHIHEKELKHKHVNLIQRLFASQGAALYETRLPLNKQDVQCKLEFMLVISDCQVGWQAGVWCREKNERMSR